MSDAAGRVTLGCRALSSRRSRTRLGRHASAWLPGIALLLAASFACRSGLALRLRLQARTQLEVHAEQVEGELHVRGRLTERRGGGLAAASVSVRPVDIDAADQDFGGAGGFAERADARLPLATVVRTDASGRFEAVFPRLLLPSDRESIRVRVAFAGDPAHAKSDAGLDVLLGQAAARLEVSAEPARLTTDMASTQLRIRGQVGSLPLAGRGVSLRIDNADFAAVTLDDQGDAEVDLPTAALLPKGVHTISVELPARPDVAAATARLSVEVLGALRVTWHLVGVRGAAQGTPAAPGLGSCGDDTVCLEGVATLADGRGGSLPAPWALITIHAARTRLGTVVAGEDGAFVVRLRLPVLADLLPPGPIGLVAEAGLAEPWISPGWSEVVAIDVPRPVAPLELLYGGVLALLVSGLLLRLVRGRLRDRRVAIELAKADAGLTTTMHAGQGHERLRLRGMVRDGELGRALVADLTLHGPLGRRRELSTSGDGRFDFGVLDAGTWRLSVWADGHAELDVPLEIPHDGAFDGCQLMPVSLRAVARHSLSSRIAAASGRGMDWSSETPRTAEPRWLAARRRGHVRIRAAVRVAEAAIYGKRVDPVVLQGVHDALHASDEGEP